MIKNLVTLQSKNQRRRRRLEEIFACWMNVRKHKRKKIKDHEKGKQNRLDIVLWPKLNCGVTWGYLRFLLSCPEILASLLIAPPRWSYINYWYMRFDRSHTSLTHHHHHYHIDRYHTKDNVNGVILAEKFRVLCRLIQHAGSLFRVVVICL